MLSKQEKESLADYYHNKELYEPAKEPDQEPSTFMPKMPTEDKGMCNGGMSYAGGGMVANTDFSSSDELLNKKPTHKGMVDGITENYFKGGPVKMDDGGSVGDDFSGPSLSGDTTTVRQDGDISNPALVPVPDLKDALANVITQPAPKPAPMPMPASQPQQTQAINPQQELQVKQALMGGAPAAAPALAQDSKLAPDQMQELIQALTQKQSLGQSAMSGLAGLADAIETGVARAGNPGFQKNLSEQQQLQKQNLIAALEAKYKGQGLNLEKSKLAEEIAQHAAENKSAEAERGVQQRGQDIAAQTAAAERGVQTSNQAREATQAQRDADLKVVQEYSPLKPGGYTKAQYEAASARLKAAGGAPVGQTKIIDGKPYHQAPNGKWYVGG